MDNLPLTLHDSSCLNSIDIESLFGVFKNDFIDNTTLLNIGSNTYTIIVKENVTCPCPYESVAKPEIFWHIISKKEYDRSKQNNPCRKEKEKTRAYCAYRAKRVPWIKEIINGFGRDVHIKYFFEDNSGGTHFLWDTKRFYIVLIKHLRRSDNLLVTAYMVHQNKYREYKARLNRYERDR